MAIIERHLKHLDETCQKEAGIAVAELAGGRIGIGSLGLGIGLVAFVAWALATNPRLQQRDRAAAHKLLAFIFCTSNRAVDCEVQFRSARAADPSFALSKSEAGHPLWGPVYRRLAP